MHQKGGKLPVWNHSLDFMIESVDDEITISCYDKNMSSTDNLIGQLTLYIGELLMLHGQANHQISYDRKPAG